MRSIRICLCAFWVIFISCLLYIPKMRTSSAELQTLYIFAWSDMFDDATIRSFEKESGVRVRFNYFETNEEMLTKIAATQGEGHDLIIGSDYAICELIKNKILQPLDHTELDFIERIYPELKDLSFDPKNTYSVPLQWSVLGIAYDAEYFPSFENPSWEHIYHPETKVAMVSDPIEAINITALVLSSKDPQVIMKSLREQKPYIEAYADFRVGYLLATHNCPIAATASSYIYRMVSEYPFIRFAIPKEGSFVAIENMVIPARSKKAALAYRFMNYVYRAENIQSRCRTFASFPPTKDGSPQISDAYTATLNAVLHSFDTFHFIHYILPEEQVRDIWIHTKS